MTWLPTAGEIRDVFTEEIRSLGGEVADVYHEGERLFLRSLLPTTDEVGTRDGVQGGVALRTHGDGVVIHPYNFRQVCCNGAILAWVTGSREIRRTDRPATPYDVVSVAEEVRAQVRACASGEVLFASTSQMRTAQEIEADMALTLLPFLARLPRSGGGDVLSLIERRFESGSDRSAFALMNAVTSVARDIPDPELRWELEELGGGVLARLRPHPRPLSPAQQMPELENSLGPLDVRSRPRNTSHRVPVLS